MFKLSDYDYHLPEEYIAQKPAIPRDSCKLMVIERSSGNISHHIFRDIVEFLKEGDHLVLNDTRVIYARLKGEKITGAKVEVFLLKELSPNVWEALVRPGKRLKEGAIVKFSDIMEGEILEVKDEGIRVIKFSTPFSFGEMIKKVGEVPLPPYIKEKIDDPELYQTVYSRKEGSVAAPTAGLHFTQELFEKLSEKGIRISYITLHVGIDTFRPITTEDIREHKMHKEYFEVSEEVAEEINRTKREGGRIIAVGTTTVRTLESKTKEGRIVPGRGETELYIYPGYKFKLIDGIITNFHLPKSSLLVMMAAWMGRDLLFRAYREAIERRYRFFSFGDAMFVY